MLAEPVPQLVLEAEGLPEAVAPAGRMEGEAAVEGLPLTLQHMLQVPAPEDVAERSGDSEADSLRDAVAESVRERELFVVLLAEMLLDPLPRAELLGKDVPVVFPLSDPEPENEGDVLGADEAL